MSLPVFLVPEQPGLPAPHQAQGTVVEVTGAEARHAVVVRRTTVGESVELVDGCGRRGVGEVVSASKTVMGVRLASVVDEPAPVPRLTVVQAVPKGDRGELAVEMLTEVGVDVVVPWAASRCVAVWKGERATKGVAKWRTTAREAVKQSRRSRVPVVAELERTTELVDRVRQAVTGGGLALVLHEGADERLTGALAAVDAPTDVLLVVGPEGGVSPEEIEALVDAGATSVRLGDEVLRTSTAGVVACAAVLAATRWH
ncbi:16S rRNA (uracil(1498)-N(3))-methyltransferase [Nocardioidaceae bacterium]|nr:16S rRNA (uracil(1498)-N(3))-methyltransferase [Nocardioidaceae bacterium]